MRKIVLKMGIIDRPDKERHFHQYPVPLLGGLAIFTCFWLLVAYLVFFTNFIGKNISQFQLLIIFVASLLLILVGFFDDKYKLSPKVRLLVSFGVVLFTVLFAIDLSSITNPFGGVVNLNFWSVAFGHWGSLVVLGDIVVLFWLMGMIYTTKILDGLDGLATGISLIGALMIFFLSSTDRFYQADIRLIALILTGACLGFLVFNFHPAKIFLGEGGGLWLGFILGVLAVVSGGKIATALLVMAIPILDLFWVVFNRMSNHHPIFLGDRRHIHYRLIDAGLTQRQTVCLLYLVSFLFGISTLVLPAKFKLMALLCLGVLFLVGEKIIVKYVRRQKSIN